MLAPRDLYLVLCSNLRGSDGDVYFVVMNACVCVCMIYQRASRHHLVSNSRNASGPEM